MITSTIFNQINKNQIINNNNNNNTDRNMSSVTNQSWNNHFYDELYAQYYNNNNQQQLQQTYNLPNTTTIATPPLLYNSNNNNSNDKRLLEDYNNVIQNNYVNNDRSYNNYSLLHNYLANKNDNNRIINTTKNNLTINNIYNQNNKINIKQEEIEIEDDMLQNKIKIPTIYETKLNNKKHKILNNNNEEDINQIKQEYYQPQFINNYSSTSTNPDLIYSSLSPPNIPLLNSSEQPSIIKRNNIETQREYNNYINTENHKNHKLIDKSAIGVGNDSKIDSKNDYTLSNSCQFNQTNYNKEKINSNNSDDLSNFKLDKKSCSVISSNIDVKRQKLNDSVTTNQIQQEDNNINFYPWMKSTFSGKFFLILFLN